MNSVSSLDLTQKCGSRPAFLGGEPIFSKPIHSARPRFPNISNIADKFNSALATGQVTNNSIFVKEFEQKLRELLKVPVATCCNGQSALMLMLRAAGINGGEVIVPSYTFCATPHAVKWCGAEPVFADIDPETYCLDPKDVKSRITSNTVAILGVDSYGIACNYKYLDSLGAEYNLKVLYDSAPAFGTKVGNEFLGSFGNAQCFSFHATKPFTTMEGGCVTSSDSKLIDRVMTLRNFGQESGGDCSEAGINAKMQEICAIIGLEHIKMLDSDLKKRQLIAEKYTNYFTHHLGFQVPKPPADQQPSWFCYPIQVRSDISNLSRNKIVKALKAENIFVKTYFHLPCHLMSAYKNHKFTNLPFTESMASSVISLPIYNNMTYEECELILFAIDRILRYADKL